MSTKTSSKKQVAITAMGRYFIGSADARKGMVVEGVGGTITRVNAESVLLQAPRNVPPCRVLATLNVDVIAAMRAGWVPTMEHVTRMQEAARMYAEETTGSMLDAMGRSVNVVATLDVKVTDVAAAS